MINTVHTKPLKHASTVFLIWILVATLTTSPVQAQPASPPVADPVAQAEIRSLWDGATELQRKGEFPEAIDALQKMLVMERKHFGGPHPELAVSLEFLAQLQESADDYVGASVSWQEVQAIRTRFFGEKDWRTEDALRAGKNSAMIAALNAEQRRQLTIADHHSQTAVSLFAAGRSREAITIVEQALEMQTAILGEQHSVTATSLNNLAMLYEALGDSGKAEPLFRQSMDISKKVLGEEHPSYAISLNNLGALYAAMGDSARAEPLYRQSMNIQKKVLGEEHPDYANSLNLLANHYAALGDYAKAEPLYRQALDIRKKVLGEEHPDYATSLGNLAALYDSMAVFAKAEPLYRQALEIRKRVLGEEHPNYAISLNNLALLYASLGDYAKAEPLYRQALDIQKKVLGEEHPDYAISLNNLAALYSEIGDSTRAEPLYRQSLEIVKKVLGEEHPDFADGLHNLASLYESLGDYSRAEAPYRQALDIRKKVLGEEHPDYATNLNNLGALYVSMGDYAIAEPLCLQALDIQKKVLGEKHPDYATSLNNLAALHESMADFAKAELLYRQALEIRKECLGLEHPDYASSLNNLGWLYKSMGDLARAEPLYRQALEIRKKVLGEEHPDYANSLCHQGCLYVSMGDFSKAEPLNRQALDILKETLGERHPFYEACLGNLATLYQWQGDLAKAEPLLRRALHSTRTSLEATALIQSERQQLAMSQGLRYQLDNYVSLAISSQQFNEQAFREVLAWKGATLVRQRQMRKVGENIDVAPLFQQLQETATRLATLSRLDTEPEKQVAWRRQITDLTAEKERLEAELSLKSSEFREAQKEVSLEDLLTSLPDNAALIDFLEYQRLVPPQEAKSRPQLIRSLVAFVVRRDKPITVLDLGPVAPLSEAIDVWRTTFGISRDGSAAGRLLRETIWVPVETHLDGADLILVSVDGALGRLPLAALPGREPGTFLLEDHRLAMLPVPQLLPALVSDLGRRELSGGLLLMGDVNYDADSDTAPAEPNRKSWKRSSTSLVRGDAQFAPLAATAGEIASIKELFTDLFHPEPNALKTLKQAAATEQEFRESASQFYNLHLATHGFFAAAEKKSALASSTNRSELQMLSSDRDQMIRGFNPGLLSGLAFSGANRKPEVDKDDGILTADEIATLSLDGVDLVVLSACETGLGEVAGGEGLLGVQRAFQVAGARTTVASLWQVGDVATRRLMEHFYRDYWENDMSKLDALRDAQLYLLNHPEAIRGDRRLQPGDTSEPKRLSPEFWAAFVLSGDWR